MNPFRFQYADPELSDLIVSIDPETLERRPVRLQDVLDRLGPHPAGHRIARSLPTDGDYLVPEAMDALLVRCHRELQRLALELQTGARTAALIHRVWPELEARVDGPIRIVDVGCGIGYVLRWMAATGALPERAELVGCDFNGALIEEARKLATEEALPVRFEVANAFSLDEPAHVFLSTGVLHHIPPGDLPAFFGAQREALAFFHTDFRASPLAPIGSWMFHTARMREPLAHHDGILSAVRAHPAALLLQAAAEGTGRPIEHLGARVMRWIPVPRAMHTVAMLP